ncbi:hypothetical protein AVEN_88205-1 [Araneus ventricosus]|uniref:Uncharacterized protein n=1 Tax=Araneus ventricosus TaxID=182803 RepID=A0A4Y2IM49_ARAVE|nr:hypothetical protein AVEN_88205-1 [Araneus ventricosus]
MSHRRRSRSGSRLRCPIRRSYRGKPLPQDVSIRRWYHQCSRRCISSGGAYPVRLLICPQRRLRTAVARSSRSHQAARTCSGSHLDVPSGGAYQWL